MLLGTDLVDNIHLWIGRSIPRTVHNIYNDRICFSLWFSTAWFWFALVGHHCRRETLSHRSCAISSSVVVNIGFSCAFRKSLVSSNHSLARHTSKINDYHQKETGESQ